MRPWWDSYIGLPFGEGPGEVTCWSLVVRVYAERIGVTLPAYGEISAADLARVARTMEADKDAGWVPPAKPAAFDVALMRGTGAGIGTGRRVVHVGVLTDPDHILHVEAASAAVRVPLSHWSVSGRLLGFRRLVA
jgi:cell wall-associated NlpC family hydrolase